MSADDSYVNDFKRFNQNYPNSEKPRLHSSDLRNKINKSFNKISVRNSIESDWEKRRNDNTELELQRKEKAELEWRKSSRSKVETKVIEQSTDGNLYREYVQWDFINNYLYEKGEQLMNIEGWGRQEFTNTLQRWFIFINEDFNDVPKYEFYPILPDIELGHAAAQFLRAALIEKQFVSERDADAATDKLLQAIRRRHAREVSQVHHGETGPLHVEYDSERCVVVVNKFQSREVPRVALLVSKGGVIAAARMLLRYESFGNGSYQWGDPQEVHKVLHHQFHVRYEGFASPVNSRFIEYANTHFCSLFPETDGVFGSLGNFFNVDMREHSGGWSVNPPFLNDLMKKVADRIEQVLDDGSACYFFCTFPSWTDDDGWMTLNGSRHLLKRFDLKAHHFIVQDAYGHTFEPKMAMNLFVMGELPPSVARLTELGNTLIINNAASMPDDCPW